jgi:putative addiction module component (TIGR02574 family)
MSIRDSIVQQALQLAPEDRIVVIAALEESLTSHELEFSDELLKELDRRMAEYERGTAIVYTASEVIAELRRRQADQAGGL